MSSAGSAAFLTLKPKSIPSPPPVTVISALFQDSNKISPSIVNWPFLASLSNISTFEPIGAKSSFVSFVKYSGIAWLAS